MSEFTVGEALNAAGFGRFQGVLAVVLGVYLVADAMELMLLAVLGRALQCQWGISDVEQASLTTVVFTSEVLFLTQVIKIQTVNVIELFTAIESRSKGTD